MVRPTWRAVPGCAWILLVAWGTPGAPPTRPAPAAAQEAAGGCRTEKLRFTRETACQNDGTLEFCVPDGNADLEARIRRAAPWAEPTPDERGRAKCDEARETRWVLPTRYSPVCERGAVTDEGWEAICALAALPEIERILPTVWLR